MIEFSVLHCKVCISYPLVAALTLVFVLDSSGVVFCCVLAAFLHEVGHLLAMHMLKTRTNNISFTLFDINIHDSFSGKRSFAGEFFVSLAGPLTNFIFAGLFVFLFNRFKLDILNLLTVSNIILGIFNSLPIQSLDGGNALFLFLERNFSVNLTNKILAIISFIFLFPMAVTGFFILLRSPYNFTLFFTSMYLICVLLFKSDIQ